MKRRFIRRRLAWLLAAVALAPAGCAVTGRPGNAPVVVKVIGFNDFHGTLQSPGNFAAHTGVPPAQRPAVGGADALAAHVAQLKARNPRHVVVAAGDLVGASPLISSLFHDEPTVEALNRIGLEFSAVGNHEFDRGAAELLRLQNGGCRRGDGGAVDPTSCRGLGSAAAGRFDGARFQWLSANVRDTASGRPLLPAYGVKRFDGIDVAFVGMTLEGTPRIVVPTGVAGLDFRDEADTVNALVPELRARGIEAIVVLLHEGGVQAAGGPGAALADINGCDGDLRGADGSASAIGAIVARLDDAVDLVMSGHTHAAYNCSAGTTDLRLDGEAAVRTPRPTGLPNRAGRRVPVTSASAFGRLLTDIDLTLDPASRDVIGVAAANRLVDRADPVVGAATAADPTLAKLVAGYAAAVAPLAAEPLGTIAQPLPNAIDAAGEMPAGRLVADAQLQATQASEATRATALGKPVVAFTNPGGVRTPGLAPAGARYPYAVTYGDAFTAQPFGNSLVTLTLTSRQIKDLLEQQFVGCGGQTAQRLLQVSHGFGYAWSASAPACAKVVDVTLTPSDATLVPPVATGPAERIVAGGAVLNPARSHRVTVNSFLAAGGDGFDVLRGGTDPVGGALDIDALAAYLRRFQPPQPLYDAAAAPWAAPRITRLP